MKAVFPGLLLLTLICSQTAFAQPSVTFNKDIRPILSDKCFFCHGPDGSKRQADLRLDNRESAISSGAIVPGNPDESGVIQRVLSHDAEVVMPPEQAKLGRLSNEDVETLRTWIRDGAEYENHWSFIPVVPLDTTDSTISSTLDSIVQSALSKRGFAQQPSAPRSTLIRRLSFDLNGLPPASAEVTAFVNDTDPKAVEHLVDRLLASPRYGERMAVDWLDTSRYADSYGFQVDREREVWPWRDWVIDSFNRNRPFDEFVTWQLAGDLLPNATNEQILATAFNRLHQQESEGGSVEEEYRVEYVSDRVQTVATAFLGLTFECARCHDHKYDPITQKEYYQLFSMFQNIDEAGLYSYFTLSPPTPALTLTNADADTKLAELRHRVTTIESRLADQRAAARAEFDKWLSTESLKDLRLLSNEQARFTFDSLDGNQLANSVKPDQPGILRGENRLVDGQQGQAVQFTGDDPVDLPLGNFHRHQPFSISLWLKTPDEKSRAVVMHRSRAWTDAASRGYELLIEDGRLKWSLIHFWPGNAASVGVQEKLPLNEWVHVTVASDGSSQAAGLSIYVNGRRTATETIKDALTREITGGGGDNIALGERFRDRGFRDGAVDDLRVFDVALTPLESLAVFNEAEAISVLASSPEQLAEATRDQLFEWYLLRRHAGFQATLTELQQARIEEAKYFEGLKEIMVMKELPQPKPAYVLFRGEYAQRREEVHAGVPAALSAFPDGAPRNRLGFAQWLTSPQHPLMARVTVNRVWQSMFGRGLVKTSEDFGSQGSRPLYPEVLDALADYLIRSGWDMKKLVKAIVMTQTYQQSSLADPTIMADDPDNEWLARGPRIRLSAEMIRDNALAAAGLLKEQIGGPPVNPYEMTEAFKPAGVSSGDDVYRRSIYTNWRRTGPPPAMLAFDAPRRAVCTAKRERTDSPLQALILLNGVQYVEAARVLGQELWVLSNGNPDAMITEGCMRCWSRQPDKVELRILKQLWTEQVQHFDVHPEDASQLLAIGGRKRNTEINPSHAAAATILAQALMNHDECVVKR
ncbi:MAG: DUF1553 domain-containing protein [Planctomyces sp.]|nr:DUF1553 domain-containing protein [Planctomyces sp.]